LYSIDNNPASQAVLKLDATGLTEANLALFRSRIPNKHVVLLASPPCQMYSQANTTGVIDLEAADALVAMVVQVHYGLACVCTVLENPGTGKLVYRDVVNDFLPHKAYVDYCAHGSGYFKKQTCLWSGPPAFNLVQQGFKPRECAGGRSCPIMSKDMETNNMVHPPWEGTCLAIRQCIPEALSREIGIAVCTYLNTFT
jgi:hypothetical protein